MAVGNTFWIEVKLLSRVWVFETPWTVACQAPLSMGFSRQESWSGVPFPCPGDLPNSGIEPGSPALQADSLLAEPWGKSFAVYFILPGFKSEYSEALKLKGEARAKYITAFDIKNIRCHHGMKITEAHWVASRRSVEIRSLAIWVHCDSTALTFQYP